MIQIDGSEGEGGGQILRSSLSLAICTQQPFRIVNIRANREKPGLMRQHLTSVKAAAEICDAEVDGAEMGSRALTFRPGRVKQEFKIHLPRPRHIEETDVARTAREILDCLREEINKSLEVEYADEKAK